MTKVKICGLTNYNDALDATNLGADFLGFHLIKDSPKKVSEKLISDIISKLPSFVTSIAVFSDEEEKTVSKIIKKMRYKKCSV
jgi:phosphoribosylanthranilate isomerase